MRAIVPDPFPAQKRPWRHRCHTCHAPMVENIDNRGIHCPVCNPQPYDALAGGGDAT